MDTKISTKTNRLKSILLITFCLAFNFSLDAQNEKINSLYSKLSRVTVDTAKIDVYNELAYEYYLVNVDSNFYYAEKALELAKRFEYQKGIANALNYLAIGYSISGDDKKAIELNEEAYDIAKKNNFNKILGNISNDKALSYQALGMPKKALSDYLQAVEYGKLSKDDKLLCFTYENISALYFQLGHKEKGALYRKYTIEAAEQSDHHVTKHYANLYKGKEYLEKSKLPLALIAFKKAMTETDDLVSEFIISGYIIDILLAQRKYSEAKELSLKYNQKGKEINNREIIIPTAFDYANILFLQRKYSECVKEIDQSIYLYSLADETSIQSLNFYKLKSIALNESGNYKAAIENIQHEMMIQEKLQKQEKVEIISQLNDQHELREKEKENVYLKAENDKNEIIIRQKSKESWLYLILTILLTVISFLAIRAFLNKRKFNQTLQEQVALQTKELHQSNKELKASNSELERFTYIASHDLKEPLRNISSFSTLIERRIKKAKVDPDIGQFLTFIKNNIVQMSRLIDDVLAFSMVENGEQKIQTTDINEVLKGVTFTLGEQIKERNASIHIPETLPVINSYPQKLFVIFQNLINNGIEFNDSEHPEISIDYRAEADHHLFSVIDNGIGIPEDFQSQIFEMFKRLHNRKDYKGSGLGLSICKKILDRMEGKIWMETIETGGTKFYFSIPIEPVTLESSSIVYKEKEMVV